MPTALIVEDEPEANHLLSMLVRLRGYQTASAFTGGEALQAVGQSRPDIVFLDLMLPDITGFDVCEALKSSRPTSAIPVVMVTARLADENRVRGFRAGATDYVPKPYTPDQIFGAMAQADAWRERLKDEGLHEGAIPLDPCGDVAHLREISRLWSLLLARTPLAEDVARTLDLALVEIALRAVAWGRRAGSGLVATLLYRWEIDRVVFTLTDESGWLAADPPDDPGGLGGAIARGRFDDVAHESQAGRLRLTRLFPGRA